MLSRSSEAGSRWRTAARSAAFGLSALALTAGLLTNAVPSAQADPPLTIKDAKAQVEQLETDSGALDQQWLAVEQKIKTTKADLAQHQSDLQTQTTKVNALRAQFSQIALAEFQNRNVDTRAQLFLTRDTQGFLSQISTVEKVSDNQNAALQNYQAQQSNLASLQRAEAADLAGLQADEKKLTSLRSDSDAKIAAAKAVLAKLTEEQRQKIAAEQAKQEAEAKKAAEAGTGKAGSANGRTGTTTTTSGAGAPTEKGTGKGAIALAFAKSQIGKPYRFGATGPGSYDCSGLTLAAWKSAGVSLDRTSQAQFSDGQPVAKSDLQPGDLVFFYSGISHVAIYAGNGMVVHAPHAGASVTYIKMSYMPYAGARRPG